MEQTSPKLITIEQAAEITSMSPSWWRAAVNGRKPMPPVRVRRLGGSIRIHLSDLLAFIDGEAKPKKRGRPLKKPPEDDN